MANRLRIFAALVLLAGFGFWGASGANRGWTKNSVALERTDEVTGIVSHEYRKKFVPGVDFLAGILLAAGALAGVSIFFRKPPTSNQPQPT